jgi:peptidyl-prolyl cis-trans isomerase B (cyclophilin B)
MSSVRDRQRAAARARLEREMAARAEAARRKRLLQARIGAGVAGALVLAAVVWIIAAVSSGGEEPAQVAAGTTTCEWRPVSPEKAAQEGIKDVGTPPATVPNTGYQTMTINTNLGLVKVEMDLSKTPCTAASFTHLAAQKFFDNTTCFRLVPTIFALQCGAESNTGGPTYEYADENLPDPEQRPRYRDGEVANANGGPNTNGSQFFFIFGVIDNTEDAPLGPNYSVLGRVVEGLDIVKRVAAAGFTPGERPGEGVPKLEFKVTSVTVSEPTPDPTPPPAGATPTAAPTGSAPPSPAPPTASPTP